MPRTLYFAAVITLLTVAMIGCASSKSSTVDAAMRLAPSQLTPEEVGGEVISFADTYVALLCHVGDQY